MVRVDPYAHCPRLPLEGPIDLRTLVAGDWLEIDVGPGRGTFLFERAEAEPRAGLVGLEVRRKWATLVDERLAKRGVGARARVFAEDAKAVLPRVTPDACIARVYLHFPDPWWKKRHEKRLVMGDTFLAEVARLLVPGGELFVQSDVEERIDMYEAKIAADPSFVPHGDREGSARIVDHDYIARSHREHRAIQDGLPVYRLRYRRALSPPRHAH